MINSKPYRKRKYNPQPENSLRGLIVALLTPFDNKSRIDKEMLICHLTFLQTKNVNRIIINGTAGEFYSLTQWERKLILKLTRSNFPGYIIFQAGCESLIQTEEMTKWGVDNGADAIISLPPYYPARAPKQGIIDYLNKLSNSISIPFLIYNIPKHTKNPITPDMLAHINHFGVKDSSANFSLVKHTPHYYIGSDTKILSSYKAGSHGFVSTRANHLPEIYVKIEKALLRNDMRKAKSIQKEIFEASDLYSGENQIAIAKYALSKRVKGYPINVRLPLVKLSKIEINKIAHR